MFRRGTGAAKQKGLYILEILGMHVLALGCKLFHILFYRPANDLSGSDLVTCIVGVQLGVCKLIQ